MLDPRALPVVPWRNGAGTTRELLAGPDGAWRVSLAAIPGPAPYSRFAGADRVSCVVDGAGLALTVDGVPRTVRRGEVLAYPGEAVVVARPLGGPVQNLNLVLDRARARGTVRVVACTPGTRWPAGTVAVWVLAGGLVVADRSVPAGRVLVAGGAAERAVDGAVDGAVVAAGRGTAVVVGVGTSDVDEEERR